MSTRALDIPRRRRPWMDGRWGLLVAAGILLFLAGYLVADRHGTTREVTGPAKVGDRVATLTVDGTSYGIAGSVAWIDAGGGHHDDGWPACLPPESQVTSATFGVVRVDYPNGSTGEQVVFVDCSARSGA